MATLTFDKRYIPSIIVSAIILLYFIFFVPMDASIKFWIIIFYLLTELTFNGV
jgi:hypothetical protein